MERVAAQHHFEMPQRSQEGLYLPWGQARKVPGGLCLSFRWARTAARGKAPVPPTCFWALWVRSTDPHMARWVVLSTGSPHTQLYPCGPWEL